MVIGLMQTTELYVLIMIHIFTEETLETTIEALEKMQITFITELFQMLE